MKYNQTYLTLLVFVLFFVSCSSSKLKNQTPEEKKAEIYYGQGTSELVAKNYSEALNYLTKAREFNPLDSRIRNNLGMTYFFKNQEELAKEQFKKAISLDEKNSDARMNLGSLYLAGKHYKEAKEQFEKVLEDLTFQNQFRNYYNLALVALVEGDRSSAFQYLFKSIGEKNDYCSAHFKLGELYFEEYRFQKALESFKESGKGTCVNEPAPHYQQAMTLLSLNKPIEAKLKFKEIIEKFHGTPFFSLASIQIKKLNESDTRDNIENPIMQTEVLKKKKIIETPNF